MSAPAPQLIVADDAQALASATATEAVSLLAGAIRERGVAHLAVTGGSILEAVLAELVTAGAASPGEGGADWSRVHVWWGDERYVPAGSDDRNDRPARAKAFDLAPLDAATLHPMPSSDAGFGDDLDAAAAAYAAELAAFAGPRGEILPFDLVLLGIGPDGHCASLFPDHPGTRMLDTSVIGVRNSPKPPPERLSLSFPGLNAASEIWVVASGDGKADAVAAALGGAEREHVPSAGARGRLRTLWRVDRDAASKLPGGTAG